MGIFYSCFGDNKTITSDTTPHPEVLRLRQLEAIEKRLQSQDNRGIKNPGRIARMQKKAEERDKILNQVSPKCGTDSGGLRWQMN